MNIEVNYLAVLLAGVVSMVAGFVYYSPAVLGKPWMKYMKYSPDEVKKDQKQMGKFYGISFILSLVMSYVLYHVMVMSMNFFNYDSLSTGITSAIWMWLGFIMPVQFTGVIFSKDHSSDAFKALGINTGYQLVSLLLMGLVIGYLM
jgi:hypothetical protein